MKGWADALELAAAIAADGQVRPMLDDPKVTDQQVAELFIAVGGEAFDQGVQNFITLLAENGRLIVLPEIAGIYAEMMAEAEAKVEAIAVSAQALDAAQQAKIADSLKARLGREISLSCEIDESLIGGAVIRAGDLVIDGSVKAKLGKLTSALRH
ncbi:F0F1 ATP synthase subunit delta [Endothiovibrio diazotrophicus]